jgi:hypothetical protein
VYSDGINLLGDIIVKKKNIEALIGASKEVDLEHKENKLYVRGSSPEYRARS